MQNVNAQVSGVKQPRIPLKVLTWHIHGSYLYYLTQSENRFFLPVKPGRPEGYGGCSNGFRWGKNVHEVLAEEVQDLEFDCILFQSRKNYFEDQFEILSPAQRELPKLYLEHDPPREHPTDTRHPVDDKDVLLVHVTHFNRLMWDSQNTPTRVIEHGVAEPDGTFYTGHLDRGLVVVNNLEKRGRRLGADIFEYVRKQVPLDIAGIGSESLGGMGSIPLDEMPSLEASYRFFFNPIRYTSLGLAVCEAMILGMPILGLATTEMVTVVENGVSGFVDTNIDHLILKMKFLLDNPSRAYEMGQAARRTAKHRFNLERFSLEWDAAFRAAINYKVETQTPEHRLVGRR